MKYFANPSTPAVRAAMASGRLGCIQTPGQGNAPVEGDSAWWAWLERNASRAASRRRVHDQRQRQARTDAIAMAVSAVVLGLAAFVLGLLWAVEGGWVQ